MRTMSIQNPMSAVQMNVDMYRYLGEIASDENLMAKAVKYVKKLAAKKAVTDETEYILSSPQMVEILKEGYKEIARGNVQPIALDDLWN